MRECLAAREKGQPDAWTTFNTRSMLGAALMGQGQLGDGEPLLRQGYDGMKQREKAIPPVGRLLLVDAAGRLVGLCNATARPDEAAKFLDEMWAWAETP